MNKKLKRSNSLIKGMCLLVLICLQFSCKKGWLDAKPTKSLVVPTTVADYQALLDYTDQMNVNQPGLGVVSDDNYYVTNTTYQGLTKQERSAYIWDATPNFYDGQSSSDWLNSYSRILNENITLDGIQNLQVDPTLQIAYNNVKGSALFFRCLDFYNLAQLYCKSYSTSTANSDLGLPLRTSSNVNLKLERSSVQQTYDQIIGDLLKAVPLLPISPLFTTRPSKPAAYGLLARVYLSKEDYSKAFLYADSCLQLNSNLMDYNKLIASADNPVPIFNSEVIFHCDISGYQAFRTSRLIVDPSLYRSYVSNDLRTSIFFTNVSGGVTYKGSYNGDLVFFGGIATDEIYLIRAECLARAGNTDAAMKDLNNLLQTRWKVGTYINLTAANADTALGLILNERRKELCFRGLRWTDLKRLNKDDRFKVTITRSLNGQTYTLLPNSLRYVLPIDDKEILLGGLQQNPR